MSLEQNKNISKGQEAGKLGHPRIQLTEAASASKYEPTALRFGIHAIQDRARIASRCGQQHIVSPSPR
jgi:hypothetical protein